MAETIRKNVDLDILDYYDTKIKDYVDDKVGTGGLTIDTVLSDTSTNPVQNKVIKAAIDDKADKTTATKDTDGLMSAADKTKLDNADNTYALRSKYGDITINVGRKAGTTVGTYSTAEGSSTTASGTYSHAEGHGATASGTRSHAEGFATTASGENSHAEGMWTISSGSNSCHAEGYCTTSNGGSSHAEGISYNKITDVIPNFSSDTTNNDIITVWKTKKFSLANGAASHVEGKNNLALGDASHAEGSDTVAIGDNSHTSGYFTKALHENEAAYGKYNVSNDDTLYSIGDGTADNARHNAFEITTDGGKLHDKDIATTDLIPTELPANGGNADTVDGMHANDFIYPRAMLSKIDLNTIFYPCSALILADCTNIPTSNSWGTLLCYSGGTGSHVQLWVTATDSSMFKRHYDGARWSDWKEISTTPIKSVEVGGTTNIHGNFMIWKASDRKIPVYAKISGYYVSPFLIFTADDYYYYLGLCDAESHEWVTNTAVLGTVYYIEI